MTQIVISIPVRQVGEVDAALEHARIAAGEGAALIEWRLDALAMTEDAVPALRTLLEDSPLPCIITARPAWEGGDYEGNEDTRANFLAAALTADHPPRYVDVELAALERDAIFRETIEAAHAAGDRLTSVILSTHDFEGRPPDLLQRVSRMSADPLASIVKIAWRARSLRDNLEAFDLMRSRLKPMTVMCMGPFGFMSRVLAPKFGGMLTYCAAAKDLFTAPGQATLREMKDRFRFDSINEATRVHGVIGWPVEQSPGPDVHNAAFANIGHEGVYLPLPVPPEWEHFKATVGALLDDPRLHFRGASVTIPHKEHLVRFVRERGGDVDDWANRCGAANTLVVQDDGSLRAANTDAPAIVDCVHNAFGTHAAHETYETHEAHEAHETHVAERRVAVLGAGGAARAAIAALRSLDMQVTVINRTRERAVAVVHEMKAPLSPGSVRVGDPDELRRMDFDLIINCTPIGMAGGPMPDQSPLDALLREGQATLRADVVIFDTVARPKRTKLIAQAEASGAKVITGEELFMRQGMMQFTEWTGLPAPEETFRECLARCNGE